MIEIIESILPLIAKTIDVIGVIILLYGFIKALVKFFRAELGKNIFDAKMSTLQSVRCEIGIYILLALDFLIVSDIIHSVLEMTQQQLIELSVMIIIRTAIGYFLGKEIKELEEA